MQLKAVVTNIRWGQTPFGCGPKGGHLGMGYIADVHIFHDKVNKLSDGRLMGQRLYMGEFVSTKEPIGKNLEQLCEIKMKRYREELVDAAQQYKKQMLQKDKEDELNEKFANFTVEE